MGILEPSIKSLFLKFQFDGQLIATGTGFILKSPNGYAVVTARHNVTGRHHDTGKHLSRTCATPNEIVIAHNYKNKLGTWVEYKENLYSHDQPLWFEHPVLKEKADFVALPLTKINDIDCYPYDLTIKTHMVVKPTDALSVVGFPFGLTGGGKLGIWATGFVASEPEVDYNDLPVFLIDCRTR